MLVVAVSSRALFDFSEENAVFERSGLQAYQKYQRAHESIPLKQGACFSLVRKLLSLNQHVDTQAIEVILCSRNSADTGLRVFNSITHFGLPITRAFFTDGQPVHPYLKAYHIDLFLSAHEHDVVSALNSGIAAATILPPPTATLEPHDSQQLRIAFDADCVLFSDAPEIIHRKEGLAAFAESEKVNAHVSLEDGPFSHFLRSFGKIQSILPGQQFIRTALVTARSAPAHERVIRTLRQWDVSIDESFFLGGYDKSQLLSIYQPDIFFDDLRENCALSAETVPTGHVPYGITNDDMA
ncbi:MAG TPA: 5'-nucleotidase [Proteobacteria bacterium]|nr:5'-nucleotidase [Pseudomonadota bacterium]